MTDREAKAVALYLAGASMNAAAKAVGAVGQTVERWLVKRGISIRRRRPVYPAALRDLAINLYSNNLLSAAAVAKELNLKTFTIKEWLVAAKVIRSMSEAAAISISHGGKPRGLPHRGRYLYRSLKTGDHHYAESSYELLRMKQLDADLAVLMWDRCRIRVRYFFEGHRRTYVPDFQVTYSDGGLAVEEIKPRALVATAKNRAKFKAARKHFRGSGSSFQILTEAELGFSRSATFERALFGDLDFEQKRARRRLLNRSAVARRLARETPRQRKHRLKRQAAARRASRGAKPKGG